MATKSKYAPSDGVSSRDGTVVYRGIKIAPIPGKRSSTAAALRQALKEKADSTHGRAVNG